MAGTLIPPNRLRKKARAVIDSTWEAGNRKLDANGTAAASELPARRSDMMKKIEEITARRNRRRALGI